MTIDVVFMTKNEVVLCITMGVASFYCKSIRELTTEELKKWIPSVSGNEKTYTDKEFIEKVWRICVHYGYILENYDVTELDSLLPV